MGKNMQGGKKAKSMARKGTSSNRDVPVPISTEEEIVMVTQVSGSGRFRVTNKNNTTYVAILPGAMRGRKKRNNYVNPNSFLLINNRSTWQTIKPLAHVDIEYVYSDQDAKQLRLQELFQSQISALGGFQNTDNSAVSFSNKDDDIGPAHSFIDDSTVDNDIGELDKALDIDLI